MRKSEIFEIRLKNGRTLTLITDDILPVFNTNATHITGGLEIPKSDIFSITEYYDVPLKQYVETCNSCPSFKGGECQTNFGCSRKVCLG